MSSQQQMFPQLIMRRPYLHNLPQIDLPAGYAIRSFREGDQQAWEKIIQETFETDAYRFDKDMKGDPAYQAQRVIFVTKDDTPVATAAAWQKERFGPVIGCMHMVGVRPGHQGKNLGYWVSLGAMHQFVAEGKIEAVLETDDFRIPAVKIYLKIGFEPVLIDENQRQRWKTVFNTIQRPDLIQRYQSILDGPMVRLS